LRWRNGDDAAGSVVIGTKLLKVLLFTKILFCSSVVVFSLVCLGPIEETKLVKMESFASWNGLIHFRFYGKICFLVFKPNLYRAP
jgi:hypothetical protein